jgi:hypothetical protein
VHGLDAGDDLDGRPEGLEPHHRPSSPLDGSVILLDDVVQVLALPKLDVRAAVGHQCAHGGRIGAALVDGDLLGHIVQVDRALEEAARSGHVTVGGQEEVHRLAELVDRAVQILPLTAYQHIGLVDSPGLPTGSLRRRARRRQHRQHLQRPAVNGCVVDQNATLGHHLFQGFAGSAGRPRTSARTPA